MVGFLIYVEDEQYCSLMKNNTKYVYECKCKLGIIKIFLASLLALLIIVCVYEKISPSLRV